HTSIARRKKPKASKNRYEPKNENHQERPFENAARLFEKQPSRRGDITDDLERGRFGPMLGVILWRKTKDLSSLPFLLSGSSMMRDALYLGGAYPVARAEYTIGVEGCGKRTTFVVVCPDTGEGCLARGAG